jgi:hypothetical protein
MFQTLLVSLGVTKPRGLPVAKLATLSGVGRETWRRCASEGDLPKLEAVPAMADALRECGRDITDEQMQQAVLADLASRHTKIPPFRAMTVQPGASPADLMLSVLRGMSDKDERDKLIRQFAAVLTSEERVAFVTGMVSPGEPSGGGASTSDASTHE